MTEPANIDALIAELQGFAAGSESARATFMRDAAATLESVYADSLTAQAEHARWQERAEKAERAGERILADALARSAELRKERERETEDKLIEAAAKAIRNAMYLDEAHVETLDDEETDFYSGVARAALDVFEKAHAPTDEERDDLAHIIRNAESDGPIFASTLADVILAAGFRRSDVPEPQGEPTRRGTFGHVWPCPLFYVGNWKKGEDYHYPAKECSNPAVCEAEPQGEPSDAAVQSVSGEIGRLFGWIHLVKYGGMTAAWMDELRRAIACAALHAACEARGEGR